MQQHTQVLRKSKQLESIKPVTLRFKISIYLMIAGLGLGFISLKLAYAHLDQSFFRRLSESHIELYFTARAIDFSDKNYVNAQGKPIQTNSMLELFRHIVSKELRFKQTLQCQANPYLKECTPPLVQISSGQMLSISSFLLLLSILLLVWPQRGLASLALGLCLLIPGSFFLVGSAKLKQSAEVLDEQSYLEGKFHVIEETRSSSGLTREASCENANSARFACYWLFNKLSLLKGLVVLAFVSILVMLSYWGSSRIENQI